MRFRFRNYNEFWPYYLRSHSRAITRGSHYLGIGVVFALAGIGIALDSWIYLAAAIPAGYMIALCGHILIEHNFPVTCFHPFWSIRSVFRMLFMAISGRLRIELLRWRVTEKRGRNATPFPGSGSSHH